MKLIYKILTSVFLLTNIFMATQAIAKDRAALEIIEDLQETYTELNKENLTEHLSRWSLQVENYLSTICANNDLCEVKYMIDSTHELGTDYTVVPLLFENNLIRNNDLRAIAFSLGSQASIGVRKKVDAPVFFKSSNNEKLVAFNSYIKMTNLTDLDIEQPRTKDELLTLLDQILERSENPNKKPIVYTGDKLPLSESGLSLIASNLNADDQVYAGRVTNGFTEESPYIWIESVNGKNIVYKVNNTLEVQVNLNDDTSIKDTQRLSIHVNGEQKSINFPFVELPSLSGLYYLYEAKENEGLKSKYFVRRVNSDLKLIGQLIPLTSSEKNTFIYTIPNKKEELITIAEDFNLTPSINTIYSLEHSAELFLKSIHDPNGRIKKLIIPNIEGLPAESRYFDLKRLVKLSHIEVPFFIADNYQEVRKFRDWQNFKAQSADLKESRQRINDSNIQVIAPKTLDLTQGSLTNKGLVRFFRSSANGFPFAAFRLLNNNPESKQLVFVIKIKNADKMNTKIRNSFRASLICNANETGRKNEVNKNTTRSETVRLKEKQVATDGYIHLNVDISSLEECNTLDEQNLLLSTALTVPKDSGIVYESFDWYIQKK